MLIIDGGPRGITLRAAPSSAILLVRETSIILRNVTLAEAGDHGLVLADCGEVVLDHCRIVRGRGTGVSAVGGGRLSVRGGRLAENLSHGIEAYGSWSLEVARTAIERNGQAGLAAFDRARAAVSDCTFDSNGRHGMTAADRASVHAERTYIGHSGFAAVGAAGEGRVSLASCRIEDGRRFGVLADGRASLDLRDTAVTRSGWRGLELQNAAAISLHDCSIEQSGNFGIVAFGRSAVRIDGGRIAGNRGHGLAVREHAAADVSDCTLEQNECSGAGAPDACDGGRLRLRRCVFRRNGLRPVCRGPRHIDPPVPTVVGIAADRVTLVAAPRAQLDLYADAAGEASRYLRTVTADAAGHIELALASLPSGEPITAAATTPDGHTSEFNVVAGPADRSLLAALLARCGPLSDAAGAITPGATVQRWPRGTQLVFVFEEPPPAHIRTYVSEFLRRLPGWLGESISVDARFDAGDAPRPDATRVPITMSRGPVDELDGVGGTTFTHWDERGHLTPPTRIVLARPRGGEALCPRIVVHEMCHALGLYHARVGLLSRMQGTAPPLSGYVNDFAPVPTYYDVMALRALYDPRLPAPAALSHLVESGLMPAAPGALSAADDPVSRTPLRPHPGAARELSATPHKRNVERQ